MAASSATAEQSAAAAPKRITAVVASLATANVLGAASGFVTGPLLARALGASGRGDLAAVVVPLALLPPVLSLGLTGYAYRELPRGRRVGEVIGSLGLPLLVIGLVAAASAIPIADALAGGRETVRTFLIVGFLSMPLLMIGGLLQTSLSALERWRAVALAKLIPFALALAGIVTLYAVGRLTVATAATVTIAGWLLSLAPGLPLMTGAGRPNFRFSLMRDGISFGLKGWVGGLALIANARLDQFLMITAVAPRELGLYAVATTLSGASTLAVGALTPPLMARIGAGETHLMSHAVRIAVSGTLVINLALGLITPTLLVVLFGPAFRDAVPMAIVLLAANVPFSGAAVISSALQADGAPLIASVAEGIALLITVVGLIALLQPLGGLGAAIVSFAAYGASFLFQLVMARRRTGVSLREFLVPSRADARWARGVLADVTLRLSVTRRS
jgi:O-antigen/teichoic acid export membrane protein